MIQDLKLTPDIFQTFKILIYWITIEENIPIVLRNEIIFFAKGRIVDALFKKLCIKQSIFRLQ